VGLDVAGRVDGLEVGEDVVATGAMLGNFVGADVVGMFEGDFEGDFVGTYVSGDVVGSSVGSDEEAIVIVGAADDKIGASAFGFIVGADVITALAFEGAVVVGWSVTVATGESVGVALEGGAVGGDGAGGTSNVTPKLTVLSSPSLKSKHSDRFVVGCTAFSTSSLPNNPPSFPFPPLLSSSSLPIRTSSLNTYPLGGVGIIM